LKLNLKEFPILTRRASNKKLYKTSLTLRK